MNFTKNLLCQLLIAGMLLPSSPAIVSAQTKSKSEPAPKGLQFRLSEGKPKQVIKNSVTPASSLSIEETEKILQRLEIPKTTNVAETEFAFRDRSLPPPRTGKTIAESFPNNVVADAPVTSNAALEVVRFSPEGEVPLAPQLSVTFSQPMVAVTSQEEAAKFVPVKITPEVAGKWRWIGTKTIIFDPLNRFPMASEFRVEIPAGTKSAIGKTLSATKSFTFKTPPPQVTTVYPKSNEVSRNPLFFVGFDQQVDPNVVLQKIKLNGAGKSWKLRLATSEEIQADKNIKELAADSIKNYWLVFRAISENSAGQNIVLPSDSSFEIVIPAGTLSIEGTRPTINNQTYSFKTYGRFQLIKSSCDGETSARRKCSPYFGIDFKFSHNLDENLLDEKLIQVIPKVENLEISGYGEQLSINGNFNPLTSYQVVISPNLTDEFGQKLGASVSQTFRIGRSDPNFFGAESGLHTLDPYGSRSISYYSTNYKSVTVTMYSVQPEQYSQFLEFEEKRSENKPAKAPGQKVFSRLIPLNAKPEETIETRIDLSPALKNGYGHVMLVVTPDRKTKDDLEKSIVWIQSTNIGLDSFVDETDLIGWATSLKDGKPLAGVNLQILDGKISQDSAETKADGLAKIGLPENASKNSKAHLLLARKGEDSVILPAEYNYRGHSRWNRIAESSEIRWHVFDDRGMYRPGEEVHFKGYIRRLGKSKNGDVEGVSDVAYKINYSLKDSRSNEITKGTIPINNFGAFEVICKLPDNINLGDARLELNTITSDNFSHRFQVQEFRRPEYEVTASVTTANHFIGGSADLNVSAAYFAGGGLSDAATKWNIIATPVNFTPPNRDEFTFGKWTPWWTHNPDYEIPNIQNFNSKTGADGKHHLHIDFDSADSPRPYTVKAEASVTDVNRQQWMSSAALLVHPADLYVGLRADRTFVEEGQPLTGQAIVTDLEGKAISGRAIKLRAVLLVSSYKKGEWIEEEKDPQEFTLTSSNEAIPFKFTVKSGGTYRVTAEIRDDKERLNQSEMQLWVAGGKIPHTDGVENEEVKLIPNQQEFHAEDTAEILVQAPFFPAEGVMTLRRSGIVETSRFTMNSASHTLKIPIKETWTPNIFVQVDLVGATLRGNEKSDEKLPKRPAFASGNINLKIPPLTRKLNVTATPRHKSLAPGGETTVDLEVRDHTGKAVANSEAALIVVDEAILALSDYKLSDPLATFYPERDEQVIDQHQRDQLLLANERELKRKDKFPPSPRPTPMQSIKGPPPQMTMAPKVGRPEDQDKVVTRYRVSTGNYAKTGVPGGIGGGAGGAGEGGSEPIITSRVNFNPLAAFSASVITDAKGKASGKIKLPDSLTRYRVMVVATDGAKKFGTGESSITANLPLMIRPSAPRFLNFGDQFALPVVLQNQTDQPLNVNVAVRDVEQSVRLLESGKSVIIPANDRVEIRFPVITNKPGTAHFQIAATTIINGQNYADAAEVSLPVWTPATTEAFATYGELDEGAIVQPVKAPADAFKQFGGLEITTSSTQLQALTDAVLYLTSYPYECSEQVSSRILAIAALRDVLSAFDAKGLPSAQELESAIVRDIKKLAGMQNSDGGFSFWKRDEKSWPYLSIHVAHALQRAQEKGFAVPKKMLDNAHNYLRNIEAHIPADYGIETRRALIAYSLYVKNRLAPNEVESHRSTARKLIAGEGLNNFSLETLGWILPVLSGDKNSVSQVAVIRQLINNRVEETAATAHFTSAYKDGAHLLLASNRRTDGILLEALITDQPNSDLIPKIVRGLLANRKQGRWMNTQENAFILLALDKYFRTYEKVTPDFVARVWLGDDCANEQKFSGRSTDRHQLNVPMKSLEGQNNLTLDKQGQGRLYYRIGMRYAPTNLNVQAADYGFTVERMYEAIDNPDDVKREADGSWHIKAGASVRVRLTMSTSARRYHVALVDPMPAGFEAVNPALKIAASLEPEPNSGKYWWRQRNWFEHQNLRDESVEAFSSLLWEGVYNYSYVARATTPGIFIAPPAKAEEMYEPETFGRSGSDKVIIE